MGAMTAARGQDAIAHSAAAHDLPPMPAQHVLRAELCMEPISAQL